MHPQNGISLTDTPQPSGTLPPPLKRFERWTVLFFAASVCFHLYFYLAHHSGGHMVYPLSLNSHDRFYDFTIFTEKFKLFHTAEFFQFGFPINYPAPVCLFFEFFFRSFGGHALPVFVSFLVLSFLIPAALFARSLMRRGIAAGSAWQFCAVCCLLSWPVLLIVDGGNAEVVVWLTMLTAMWAYATGRLWLAAAFFGVAASMKLFPFVFLALFLTRRNFTRLLFGAATFLVVSVVSLLILGPTIAIAYRGIAFGLASFKANYMAQFYIGENGVDHSLFASIKFILILVFHHPPHGFTHWLSIYLVATAVGGTLLFFLRIRFMPLLNQVLTLSIACIYLTAFSGDGTLIHLYYPLGMLLLLAIQAWRDGVVVPGMRILLSTIVFCVSMESFLVVPNRLVPEVISNGQGGRFIGPAHCIGLTIMLIAALVYPMGPPLSEGLGETVLSEPVTDWVPGATVDGPAVKES